MRTTTFSALFAGIVGCSAALPPSEPLPDGEEQGSVPVGGDAGGPSGNGTEAGTGSGADAGSAAPPDAAASEGGTRPAPSGCVNDVTPGHHVYACSGVTMDVEVPAQCATPRACGLVVDAHGLTMDAEMEDANTKMRALGAKYGFIVVQPNANPAPPFSSWDTATDDPILYDFLVTAIEALAVDPARVHFSGFSDGGDTTFRFLCKHADLFASVAPAAGSGCTFQGADTPSRPIHVLYLQGTKDALVDYQKIAVPQRDAIVSGWKMGSPQVVEQGTGFVRTRWTSPAGTVLEFLQHDYAANNSILVGHCFPGSTDQGSAQGQLFAFSCVPPNGFTWGEEVMKFFVAHP